MFIEGFLKYSVVELKGATPEMTNKLIPEFARRQSSIVA